MTPTLPLVDSRACAVVLDKSLGWLKKDRSAKGKRLVPFVRVGSEVKYDLDAVRRAFPVEGGLP